MSVKPETNYKLSCVLETIQKEYMAVAKGGGGSGCSCARNTHVQSNGRCCCGSGMTFGGNR